MNSTFNKVFRSGNPVLFYIGLNVVVFVIFGVIGSLLFLQGSDAADLFVTDHLALPADIRALPARIYTLITYQFLHAGILHILFNMITLFWTGTILIDFIRTRHFHFVYLLGGVSGGLLFILFYNIFPAFESQMSSNLLGASAAVMAIAAAAATLVPDYTIRLLLFGFVKLKHVVIVLIVIDLLLIRSGNPGGRIAHIGGALAGFLYIRLLNSGVDLSTLFKRKARLKVVKNNTKTAKSSEISNQAEIDAILDKISRSGYENLSREEKEKLFKASKE